MVGRGWVAGCVLGADGNQVQWDPELRNAEERGWKCFVVVVFFQSSVDIFHVQPHGRAAVDEGEEETVCVLTGLTKVKRL